MNIEKRDDLIEQHYISVCNRNPDYTKKYSREKMKTWWIEKLENSTEVNWQEFIKGATYSNTQNIPYHPV